MRGRCAAVCGVVHRRDGPVEEGEGNVVGGRLLGRRRSFLTKAGARPWLDWDHGGIKHDAEDVFPAELGRQRERGRPTLDRVASFPGMLDPWRW